MEKIGEDGISLREDDNATSYSNYQVYCDLRGLKYSDKDILISMKLNSSQLEELKKKWGE